MLLRLHVAPRAQADPTGLTLLALSRQGRIWMAIPSPCTAHRCSYRCCPPRKWPPCRPTALSRRLREVGFADLNMQVRQLLQQGKSAEAKALLHSCEAMAANYPWLARKLAQLKALL